MRGAPMKDFDLEQVRAECAEAEQVLAMLREAVVRLKANFVEMDYQLWAMKERQVDEAADRLGLCSGETGIPSALG